MDIFDAFDMLRGVFWAITHPVEFLKRTAGAVGGAFVGCLTMGIVILLAILISGALGFTGQAASFVMWGGIVMAVVIAALAVRWYLRRIPRSWRSIDEPEARNQATQEVAASPTFTGERAPSLAELDARLAPSAPDERQA